MWKHRFDGRNPTASRFLPITSFRWPRRRGLIVRRSGEWVMKEACKQMLRWQDQGLRIPVAVNVSAKQFRGNDFVHDVQATLANQAIHPQYLTLDLTETLLMEKTEQTEVILHHLQNTGVKLAMDDFGTGYSSLSYLKRFPLHELKIDRGFLKEIGNNNREDKALISAMINLGHEFGLQVVAEGVEEQEQLQILADLGCHGYQGYFYSAQVTPEKLSPMFGSLLRLRITSKSPKSLLRRHLGFLPGKSRVINSTFSKISPLFCPS